MQRKIVKCLDNQVLLTAPVLHCHAAVPAVPDQFEPFLLCVSLNHLSLTPCNYSGVDVHRVIELPQSKPSLSAEFHEPDRYASS